MSLFQLGNFTLNCGAKSNFKIECDDLTDEDVETLAVLMSQMVKPFSSVEGIPRGGLRLAKAMEKYVSGKEGGLHVFVDDVLTTGRSFITAFHNERKKPPLERRVHTGIVVFARGQCPEGVRALFQMPKNFKVITPEPINWEI